MSTRDSRAYGRWRLWFRIAAGLTFLVSVVISLARFVEFSSPLLYGAVPVAPAVAAVTSVAVAATIGRRVTLATGATVLVAIGLVLPGPVIPRTGCDIVSINREDSANGEPSADGEHSANGEPSAVILLSHNVRWHRSDAEAVATQINSVDPDVVLLQESASDFLAELLPLLDEDYGHVISTAEKTTALAVLSRWPLSDVIDTWGHPYDLNPFLIATVDGPNGSFRIANVHPSAPISDHLQQRHKKEFREMFEPSFQEGLDVIAGDFNSSASHLDYRRLAGDGWVDAHREAGCGLGLTWSNLELVVGMMSLDHVLAADSVTVEEFQILDFAGSDHRAIAAAIKLEPVKP